MRMNPPEIDDDCGYEHEQDPFALFNLFTLANRHLPLKFHIHCHRLGVFPEGNGRLYVVGMGKIGFQSGTVVESDAQAVGETFGPIGEVGSGLQVHDAGHMPGKGPEVAEVLIDALW